MIDEGIFDGDTVIVRDQKTVENGETAVALINSSAVTLKKIYKERFGFRLQPANPNLEPIFTKDLIIQGKVVSVVRSYKKQAHPPPKTFSESNVVKAPFEAQQQFLRLKTVTGFPSTRFQGSKAKLVGWIWENVKNLDFASAIDLFGGTGSVGYMFKQKGKRVIYNDYLKFNHLTGTALIENSNTKLSNSDVAFILSKRRGTRYPNFIQETFGDIYFTDEENQWLDIVATNIGEIEDKYKQALAYFALFQACIIKRPFNLFHRKNLYLRNADVKRTFGNKTTWDKSFTEHFLNFVKEANEAVFDNGRENSSFNEDAFDSNFTADLVYIDTPYMSSKGNGVDYLDFYHFLEGLCNYGNWSGHVDYNSKHRKFKKEKSVWTDRNRIHAAFDALYRKFQNSILVVSYRSDGTPSVEEMIGLLGKYKKDIALKQKPYKYVLNHKKTCEVLLIASD